MSLLSTPLILINTKVCLSSFHASTAEIELDEIWYRGRLRPGKRHSFCLFSLSATFYCCIIHSFGNESVQLKLISLRYCGLRSLYGGCWLGAWCQCHIFNGQDLRKVCIPRGRIRGKKLVEKKFWPFNSFNSAPRKFWHQSFLKKALKFHKTKASIQRLCLTRLCSLSRLLVYSISQ